MKAEIRIPTTQYGYISVFPESNKNIDEIVTLHNHCVKVYQDSLKTASVKPQNTPNSGLKPVELLRLLYKPLCGQGLTEDELETLGTEKAYSQQDILKIVQSLINKSKRDEKEINYDN